MILRRRGFAFGEQQASLVVGGFADALAGDGQLARATSKELACIMPWGITYLTAQVCGWVLREAARA